jgi:hypothetical protein
VNIGPAFVPNPEAAELVQPTDRPLHHPTEDAQAAAVLVWGRSWAAASDLWSIVFHVAFGEASGRTA